MELLNTKTAIKKSKDIWGDYYNYSLFEYFDSKTPVILICPKHGEFTQIFNTHLRSSCFECGKEKRRKENIIDIFNKKHNNKYNYSKTIYLGNRKDILVICPIHGDFLINAGNHKNGNGCRECGIASQTIGVDKFIERNESKGEKKISKILDKYNILYLREYKFKDCFYKKELPFDFYLPKHNICIEFNGKQHYESIEHFGGDIRLKEQIEKDNIRRSYCIINNIKLVEIKYDESIEEKINFIYEKEKV
jgi:very-short-patch-repair endonuclease